MAITRTHAALFRTLQLPQRGSLLEIGEANWYGDCDPREFGFEPDGDLFECAKRFYDVTFSPERIVSIDFNGSPAALRVDLNDGYATAEAIRDGDFDVVINHGTAEHIFNIAQVFRTMHDACEVGGLLVHDAPFTGWIDHGFYCLHPTLFYDLAAANNYELVLVAAHEYKSGIVIRIESRDSIPRLDFPQDSMLFVAMRKLFDTPFRVPMQGYYARTLGPAGVKAWEERR